MQRKGVVTKTVPRLALVNGQQSRIAKGGKDEGRGCRGEGPSHDAVPCRAADGWVGDQAAPQNGGRQRGRTVEVDGAIRPCCGRGVGNKAMPQTDAGDKGRAADRGKRQGRAAEGGR